MQKQLLSGILIPILALAFAPPTSAQHDAHQHHDVATVPLYDNLGNHSRSVTAASTEATAYFNQGLRLQYAFNHDEAVKSYEQALKRDPQCAMCYWGIALALGPNINAPMSPENGERAYKAIQKARELSGETKGVEKALIDALSKRYGPDPSSDRAEFDKAYAEALSQVAASYPSDADVLTLYASSLMNLRPWDYWSGDYENRVPNPGTVKIVESLERALSINPDHPGACHYYIHAVEAAYPEKAEECADRLPSLMPGAGHIVHMPGHVYIRVGRYRDAVRANDHAVHEDESFIADQSPMGIYPAAYYPHNYHFMAFAATMAGMSAKAMEAARIVSPRVPREVALEVTWIQNAVVLPQLTAVSFGRWNDVLTSPKPDPDLYHAAAMDWYARGVAYAAKGRLQDAEEALAQISDVAREGDPEGKNPVFSIAAHALEAEIALRSGNPEEAVRHFAVAVKLEDEMLYEEPPLWYYPIRHSLGRALLEGNRPAEAEKEYRRDLARFRENGWSLYGLAKSLEMQGKKDEAATVRERFKKAWSDADVELTASRF